MQFADLVARFQPASPPKASATAADATTQIFAVAAGGNATPGEDTAVTKSVAAGRDRPPVADAPTSGPAAPVPSPGAPAGPVLGGRSTGPGATGSSSYTVMGTVLSPALPGVGGLTVQLVDKNVGGDQVLASTQTSSDGSYAFNQVVISPAHLREHHKTQPDLQVQVSAGSSVLAASAVSYSAPTSVSLDVVLPAGAPGLPSEYETLTANLAAVYPGSLGALKEDASQQDITYLANKTGWDARAVALAALADQFSQITAPAPRVTTDAQQTQPWPVRATSVRPEFYYALFRAGLPANPDILFRTSPATAQTIWQQAVTSGVIPQALAKEVPAATASFQALSAARSLDAPPVGLSTLRDMLATTLPETAQQDRFAQLYAQYQGDWPTFWSAVEQALGSEAANQLQLTGQLYYLTADNQPLVAALMNAEATDALSTTLDLAARGYYDPAMWAPLIGAAIPPQIPGTGADEQASNYAQLLAAQVRLAYPTAVVADQVRRNIVPIADTAEVAADVADFLATHQGDFEIGVQPVEAYIASAGLTGTPAGVITQIKRIQRVYQLTPDDMSLAVLLRHNLDSAFAITRYDSAGFVRALGGQLGGADKATMIHARARQVFATTLSVTVAYLSGRASPTLGGASPVHYGYPPQAAPSDFPVTAYPTLEGLFGSLDYCNCSDCGSILSPAAYLVDLLNYIDQPAPAGGGGNPQDVLLQRRPDLQYLPLTCANTNTALPYIDIVNETLEYFVANGLQIAGYQGRDTSDSVTSAELIACPQYVNDAAYTLLQSAFFPLGLPFNRPLTLLRLLVQNLGITLPAAMAALRANDALLNESTPASYGWNDILIEQLAISREEYRLFTDPDLELGDLYGLPAAPPPPLLPPLQTLQGMSLQDFSRRLGVSYDDLVSILSTKFINPNVVITPLLEQLNASFATLQELNTTLNTPDSIAAQFIAALPAGLDAMQYGGAYPTDYQAVVSWVTSPQVYPLLIDLITITDPTGTGDDCSGASLQFRYSDPNAGDLLSNPNAGDLLSGTDFLKLIRFVRLWQKLAPLLGDANDAVTIEQTDNILTALYPAADIPADTTNAANDTANRPLLDAGFQTLLPRVGFLFQLMNQLSLTADAALDQLLACWAPIGTVGANSLYQNMFLTPALLQQDPGAQTATVDSTVNVGDVLTTVIDGVTVTPYTVRAGDTAVSVAAAIATAINSTVTPDPIFTDPVSNPPLNSRIFASSSSVKPVITIMAGFTLECSVSPAATESYTAAAGTPVSHSAAIAGPVTAGDTLTTTIDLVPIPYTVVSGDTDVTIAAGIAAAVNAATTADPYSGLPLNGLVVASSSGAVVTFVAADAGAPFTLACSLTPANAGTYTATPPEPASSTATITGPVAQGDILVTTINKVPVSYTATAADTNLTKLAANIAATINAAVQEDTTTLLPLSSEVQASSAGNVITIAAVDPATPVTVECDRTAGGESYVSAGPFPETAATVVFGSFPAGTTLTTTINTLPLVYLTAPGDSPATIAASIAAAITASAPGVTASATERLEHGMFEGLVTITATSPTTPFTVSASQSVSGYTAGQQIAPFANDGYGTGDFLTDLSQTLFGHEPALCAACNVTSAEFGLITTALGFDPSTPLTLANVSTLFRYGWLAHTLGLSVREFLLLREWTGLDPFSSIDPGTPPPAEPPVIRFIRLLGAFATAGLTTAQALYLIWNQDISGISAPPLTTVTGLALALAADFAAVDAQFTLQVDPDGSIAQKLMTLVYGATISATFFGLLNNTTTTSVGYSTPPGQQTLPQPVLDASTGRLSYDNLGKQLTFAGLLDTGTQIAIDAAVTASAPDVAALTTAVANLATASQQAVGPFFTTYPELLPLYTAYVASADPVQDKRNTLLASFLPILQQKRKQEQALAAISSAAGTDPSFASALLQDPTILHADADATQAAVTDLVAIENQGLSAQFFLSNNPASTPDQIFDSVPVLSYTQTATIGGTPTAGDVLTTTINGTAIAYQVLGTDTTLATLAGSVAAAINAATVHDPVSALPINQVVTASVLPASQAPGGGAVIAIAGLNPSGANGVFTLAATVPAGASETYTAGSRVPAAAGGGDIAGIWSGFLTAPQDGLYDIDIAADPGATITLQLGGVTVPGAQQGGLWSNQGPISLTAGALVPITLTATSIKTTFSVSWQSQGLGWQPIGTQYLYPLSLVSRLGNTYVRFLKAASLATALSLTAAELAYLGTATSFGVNTTDGTMITPGAAIFTPASMTNIAVGSVLVIDDGSTQETVTVTAVAATTFSAVAVHAHDGTISPFKIVDQSFLGQGWLNSLIGQGWLSPPAQQGPNPATAVGLTAVLTALLDFSRIKQALSPADSRLLAVLQNPSATLPVSPSAQQQPAPALPASNSALLSLTGWDRASVNALLTQFFGSTDPASLSTVENLRRVYDAYTIVTACRLSASVLISATTNAPTAATVGTVESALRAQYAEADWLTFIGPLNDTARMAQRDALVAYILQQLGDDYVHSLIGGSTSETAATGATQLNFTGSPQITAGMTVQGASIAPGTAVTAVTPVAGGTTVTLSAGILATLPAGSPLIFAPPEAIAIDTADSLYEYFLLDTQNEPAVLTSRILGAISTVQLFIERVVRNLEPQVSPADIDTTLWTWMKRYRVWQANREVFLWPENWLYPELRDDQSPFFQQMMSSLLQGDITDDDATSAYLTYLTSLEEVAKLEPCGMWHIPASADADETSYVIARTAGAHRKYYFRQFQSGSWTPWTQVQVECEDMPITPIVWNNRLFLFWLKAIKQPPPPNQTQLSSSATGPNSDAIASLPVSDLNNFTQTATNASQNSILVQAVLHWTEFYNGQWQPTKTSDVNQPTNIAYFDPTGSGSFESWRSSVRIVPAQFTGANPYAELNNIQFTLPGDAIILAITIAGWPGYWGGFVLHNTHSLPIRLDDATHSIVSLAAALDPTNPGRSFSPAGVPYTGGYGSGTFAISYAGTLGGAPASSNDRSRPPASPLHQRRIGARVHHRTRPRDAVQPRAGPPAARCPDPGSGRRAVVRYPRWQQYAAMGRPPGQLHGGDPASRPPTAAPPTRSSAGPASATCSCASMESCPSCAAGTGASALWFRAVLGKTGLRLRFAQPEPSRRPRRGRSMCPAGRPSERDRRGGTCRRLLVNPDWAGQSHPKTPARAGVTPRKEDNVYRHWNRCSDCNHRPGHLDAAPPLTAPRCVQ